MYPSPVPKTFLDNAQAFLKEGKILAPQKVEDEFLKATTHHDLSKIDSMLTQGIVTLLSVNNPEEGYHRGGRSLTEIALYRLHDNLQGVQLLIDKHHTPIPADFLRSTNSREVALYLIKEKGLDPYKEQETKKSKNVDNNCPFFSDRNIYQLCGYKVIPHSFLRSQDYRIIGETLNKLSGALITEVQSGLIYHELANGSRGIQAPHFKCASKEDAFQLCDFLNKQCKLAFYSIYPGNMVHSSDALPPDTCNFAAFIRAVGIKANVYEKSLGQASKKGMFSDTLPEAQLNRSKDNNESTMQPH